MTSQVIAWDVYEITSAGTSLTGVKLRGTLRKFTLASQINLLAENASDRENCVRFAVIAGADVTVIRRFIVETIGDIDVKLVLEGVQNPVLSKLKVNDVTRY